MALFRTVSLNSGSGFWAPSMAFILPPWPPHPCVHGSRAGRLMIEAADVSWPSRYFPLVDECHFCTRCSLVALTSKNKIYCVSIPLCPSIYLYPKCPHPGSPCLFQANFKVLTKRQGHLLVLINSCRVTSGCFCFHPLDDQLYHLELCPLTRFPLNSVFWAPP